MKRSLFLLACLLALALPGAAAEKSAKNAKGRLQHVVAFKFKESAAAEQIRKVETEFVALKDKIREVRALEWGTNVSPEKLDKGFTHCFVLTFKSEKARDIYLNHPQHKAFVDLVGPVLAEAFVIDFWAR
jgi:hypothetical protein